jgi:uncharacterized protein (TIGR02145 family)
VEVGGVKWAKQNLASDGYFASINGGIGNFFQWGSNVAWKNNGDEPTRLDGVAATWSAVPAGDGVTPWPAATDPCPTGWRVPTKDELAVLQNTSLVSSTWGNGGRSFVDVATPANVVFFPAVGYRSNGDGILTSAGSYGRYWSDMPVGETYGYGLDFNADLLTPDYSASRLRGFSVRCVVDDAAPVVAE